MAPDSVAHPGDETTASNLEYLPQIRAARCLRAKRSWLSHMPPRLLWPPRSGKGNGPGQTIDQTADSDWDYVVADLEELAAALGCEPG